MRNKIADLFQRLIISLYFYIPPRRKEDYYSMYYSNKLLDKMLKPDKNKNYITYVHQIVSLYLTSIKLIQRMDNKHLNVRIKYINRL